MTNKFEIQSAGVSFITFNGKPVTLNLTVKGFSYPKSTDCEEVIDHGSRVWEVSGEVWEDKSLFTQRGQFFFGFKRRYNVFHKSEADLNKTYYMSKKDYEEAKGVKVVEVFVCGDPCFITIEEATRILAEFVPYAHVSEDGYVTYTFADRFNHEDISRQAEERLMNRRVASVEMVKGSYDVEVVATLEDGCVISLFAYYPDEISFTESELVGLSIKRARELRHKKDVAYLRS